MLSPAAQRVRLVGDVAVPLSPRPTGRFERSFWLLASALAVVLAIMLPVPFNLVVGLAPLAVALCLRWPLAALYALTFSVPFESVRALNLGGLQLTSTEALLAIATAAWCGRGAARGRFDLPALPWRWALFVFGAAMILSMSQATNVILSLKELLKWSEMLLTYVMIVSLARADREVPRLFMLLLTAGIAEALVGFAQVLVHGGGVFHVAGVLRAAGTFDQPNPFAGFLNMSLPLALAALLVGVPRHILLSRVSLVITGVAVLVSLSRGAWLATLAAVLIVLFLGRPGWRAVLSVAVGTGGLVLLGSALGVLPGGLADAISAMFGLAKVDVINPTPVTWSTAERLAHWLAGLAMFRDHPILGVGIGNYAAAYKQYQVAPVWEFALGHAHNYYINMAAEAGIIGLAAYLFFLISTLYLCLRLWRSAVTAWGRAIGLGALGVILTAAVQGIFDNVFVHGMEVQVALVLSLVALSERFERQARKCGAVVGTALSHNSNASATAGRSQAERAAYAGE